MLHKSSVGAEWVIERAVTVSNHCIIIYNMYYYMYYYNYYFEFHTHTSMGSGGERASASHISPLSSGSRLDPANKGARGNWEAGGRRRDLLIPICLLAVPVNIAPSVALHPRPWFISMFSLFLHSQSQVHHPLLSGTSSRTPAS